MMIETIAMLNSNFDTPLASQPKKKGSRARASRGRGARLRATDLSGV
jgi:hypothetical protein